ncbi:MAG: DUF547 domain-containing protein [Pseudomonadota bacterium]
MTRKAIISAALCAAMTLGAANAQTTAASDQNAAFSVFAQHAPDSKQAIDYDPIDELLGAFIEKQRGRNRIYFTNMAGSGVQLINAYIQGMSNVNVAALNRDEQLAYWLNLRNLLIIRAYAGQNPRSVSGDRGTVASPGPLWTKEQTTVAGQPVSLHDIEVNIIAANWSDKPDVIYGLYQGAIGGPSLPKETFRGASVHTQLSELGKDYVNARRNVRIKSGALEAPAIYEWYKPVFFDNNDQSVIAHLAKHKKKAGAVSGAQSIAYKDFNYRSDAIEPRRQQFNNPGAFSGGGGGGVGGGVGS